MDQERIYISHLLKDEEMFRLLQSEKLGIESIEFGIPDSLDSVEESIAAYRRRLDRMGAGRRTIHGPFLDLNPASYDSRIRQVTMDRFAAAYRAAEELQADKVVFHSCMNPTIHCLEGWPEQMSRFFREFMEGRADRMVVIENVLDEYPEPLAQVMEMTNIDNLRLCLDLGHAHCYSRASVLHWCRTLAPWLSHIHIHDNGGDRDAHLGVGMGNIPWDEISPILQDIPNLTWTIECNSEEDIRRSLDYLRKFD